MRGVITLRKQQCSSFRFLYLKREYLDGDLRVESIIYKLFIISTHKQDAL